MHRVKALDGAFKESVIIDLLGVAKPLIIEIFLTVLCTGLSDKAAPGVSAARSASPTVVVAVRCRLASCETCVGECCCLDVSTHGGSPCS